MGEGDESEEGTGGGGLEGLVDWWVEEGQVGGDRNGE